MAIGDPVIEFMAQRMIMSISLSLPLGSPYQIVPLGLS